MEKYFVVLLLHGVILALSIQSGDGIKCYVCSTKTDENCKDPFNTNAIEATECSTSVVGEIFNTFSKGLKGLATLMGRDVEGLGDLSFECLKMSISDDQGGSTTIRTCTPPKNTDLDPCSLESGVQDYFKGKVKIEFCETCGSDYCNGSSKPSSSLLSFLLLLSLAFILTSYINV